MSIYCTNCGTKNKDSFKYCKTCGTKLNHETNYERKEFYIKHTIRKPEISALISIIIPGAGYIYLNNNYTKFLKYLILIISIIIIKHIINIILIFQTNMHTIKSTLDNMNILSHIFTLILLIIWIYQAYTVYIDTKQHNKQLLKDKAKI